MVWYEEVVAIGHAIGKQLVGELVYAPRNFVSEEQNEGCLDNSLKSFAQT